MKKRILVLVGLAVVLIAFFLPVLGNNSLFNFILQGPNDATPGVIWIFWILIFLGIIGTGLLIYLEKTGGILPVILGVFIIVVLLYNFFGGVSPVSAVGLNILNLVSFGFWIILVGGILTTTGGVLVMKQE